MAAAETANGLAIASRSELLSVDPRRAALAADPFEPQDFDALWRFAETVCKTPFCPKDFQGKPGDAFVAMLYGKGLGLAALQALQGVGVINGRPSVYGETFWAVVISHPEFQDVEESVDENGARCLLTRRGRTPKLGEFSWKDVQAALLDTKDTYKKDRKAMMLWRARHRAASIFADALKGIMPREVALDFIEGEVVPPRGSEPALPAASYTAAPEPAPKGDQPKPVEDPAITEEQGKAWNKAWEPVFERAGMGGKDHMKTRTDAKRAELDVLGVGRTSEMKLSQFEASLRRIATWAPTVKADAANPTPARTAVTTAESASTSNPASSASPAKEKPSTTQTASGDEDDGETLPERTVRSWMNALELSMFAQSAKIGRHTDGGVVDWGAIAAELVAEHREALREKGVEV